MVIHCGALPKKDKNDQLSKLVIEVGFVHHHCKWFICLSVSSEGAQILWAASIFHNEVQVSTLLHPSMKQHNKSNLDSDYSSSSMLGGSILGKPEKGQSCNTHRKMRLCSANLPVPGLLSLCDSPESLSHCAGSSPLPLIFPLSLSHWSSTNKETFLRSISPRCRANHKYVSIIYIQNEVTWSRSGMSDSLRPHGP